MLVVGSGLDREPKINIFFFGRRRRAKYIAEVFYPTSQPPKKYIFISIGMRPADNSVTIFDTRTWDIIHSIKYMMIPQSVNITPDSRYLTVSGESGERCIVSEIK